jgi:hypothetical protein
MSRFHLPRPGSRSTTICSASVVSPTQKARQEEYTPAQSVDCPAYGRRAAPLLAFRCGHSCESLDHKTANTLKLWRFA